MLNYVFFYNYAGIMPTEAEGIAKCSTNSSLLCLFKRKVQCGINFRIVGKMIYCWWNNIMNHTLDTGYCFNNTSGPKTMARHGFSRTNIEFICLLLKNINNSFYLGPIA